VDDLVDKLFYEFVELLEKFNSCGEEDASTVKFERDSARESEYELEGKSLFL